LIFVAIVLHIYAGHCTFHCFLSSVVIPNDKNKNSKKLKKSHAMRGLRYHKGTWRSRSKEAGV